MSLETCIVSKCIEFDAAHRVPFHESKCKYLHGHRYRVVVECEGPIIPDDEQRPDAGMVIDFGDIKAAMIERIHDQFDHRTIVWREDKTLEAALVEYFPESLRYVPCIPTAENLAVLFHGYMSKALAGGAFIVRSVEVHETPTSIARYAP